MIFIDIETTGIDAIKNSIISIGAIDFFNPKNQFYKECQIEEGKEIDQNALKVNGFSEKELRNPQKKRIEETLRNFVDWTSMIENITLAGNNTDFDKNFLKEAMGKYGIKWIFGSRIVDLHSTAINNFLMNGMTIPIKNKRYDITSDKIFVSVGLPKEPKPHNALMGAKMEAEAYSRLVFKKGLLDEFGKYKF